MAHRSTIPHSTPRVSFPRRVVESVSRPLNDSELYLIRRQLDHEEGCSLCRRGLRLSCSRTTTFLRHLDRHIYAGRDGNVYSRRPSDFRTTRVEIPAAFRTVREMLLNGLRMEESVARYVERESVRSPPAAILDVKDSSPTRSLTSRGAPLAALTPHDSAETLTTRKWWRSRRGGSYPKTLGRIATR